MTIRGLSVVERSLPTHKLKNFESVVVPRQIYQDYCDLCGCACRFILNRALHLTLSRSVQQPENFNMGCEIHHTKAHTRRLLARFQRSPCVAMNRRRTINYRPGWIGYTIWINEADEEAQSDQYSFCPCNTEENDLSHLRHDLLEEDSKVAQGCKDDALTFENEALTFKEKARAVGGYALTGLGWLAFNAVIYAMSAALVYGIFALIFRS